MSEATNGRGGGGGGGGGGAVAEAAADASVASTNNNKKEVMQSNLPLLFANGSPISLESMSLVSPVYISIVIITTILITSFAHIFQSELQHFLLFLLKCECGREITTLSDIDPPTWWPIDDVAFEDELLQKSAKKGVSRIDKSLICLCLTMFVFCLLPDVELSVAKTDQEVLRSSWVRFSAGIQPQVNDRHSRYEQDQSD
jgi:hypothetical protein